MPSLSCCLDVFRCLLTRRRHSRQQTCRLILLLLVLIQLPLSAQAARIALVIGNERYEKMPALRNPANDAADMAAKLQALGFKLVGDKAHQNQTAAQMKLLIRSLGQAAKSGDEALFYFAGHGLSGDNDNYLIPVDDREIQAREDLPEFAVSARSVLSRLEDRGGGVNVLILDACRNSRLPGKRDGGRGLSRMAAPVGSFIAYAASEGQTADDGSGRNGLFTGTLLQLMDEPGLRIDDLMGRVLQIVTTKAPEQQPMWEAKLTQPYYLKPAAGGSSAPLAVAIAPASEASAAASVPSSTAAPPAAAPAPSAGPTDVIYESKFFSVRVTGVRVLNNGRKVVVAAELTPALDREIRLLPAGKTDSTKAQTELGEQFGAGRQTSSNTVSVDPNGGVILQPGQPLAVTWELFRSESFQGSRLSLRSKFFVLDLSGGTRVETPIVLGNIPVTPQPSVSQEAAAPSPARQRLGESRPPPSRNSLRSPRGSEPPGNEVPQSANAGFKSRHFSVQITGVRVLEDGRTVIVSGELTSNAGRILRLVPEGKNGSTMAQTELGEQYGGIQGSQNYESINDSYHGELLQPGYPIMLTWSLYRSEPVEGQNLSLRSTYSISELDRTGFSDATISFSNIRLR